MDCMRELYQEVYNKIKSIDFEMLWKGFHKYEFALYTEEKVYLEHRVLEVTDTFTGNTAIEFEGKKIAIWKIEDDFWKDEITGEHIFIKGEGVLLCSENGRICKYFKKLN